MKFTDPDILITPGYNARTWQSCNYSVNGQGLFHERVYFPRSPFEPVTCSQSLPGLGTKAEIEALAEKHGGFAQEDFYPSDEANPEHFLAFRDTERALAFCRTDDFDRLCLTTEKIPT